MRTSNDNPTWPHECPDCGSPTVIYDSLKRLLGDSYKGNHKIYRCPKCGYIRYKSRKVYV